MKKYKQNTVRKEWKKPVVKQFGTVKDLTLAPRPHGKSKNHCSDGRFNNQCS